MKRIILIVALFALLMAMLPGCGAMQKLGFQKTGEDELRPVSSTIIDEIEASKFSDKTPVRLYFANEDNTKLKLEIRYVDAKDAEKSTSNLATLVVNELIKGPTDETKFRRTIPAETKLRAPVSIKDKVATVDMSKEFKTKHPGGKDAEKMTIYSIVNSLTELEGIEKVKFTIEGKVQKEYMGNFKFDVAFPRSTQLISKEAAETTSGIPQSSQDVSGNNKEVDDLSGDSDIVDGLEILE